MHTHIYTQTFPNNTCLHKLSDICTYAHLHTDSLTHRQTHTHTCTCAHTYSPTQTHVHTLTVGPWPLFCDSPVCLFRKTKQPRPSVDSLDRKTDCKILSLTTSNPGSLPAHRFPLMLPSSTSISTGRACDLGEIAGLVTRPYTCPAHPEGLPRA